MTEIKSITVRGARSLAYTDEKAEREMIDYSLRRFSKSIKPGKTYVMKFGELVSGDDCDAMEVVFIGGVQEVAGQITYQKQYGVKAITGHDERSLWCVGEVKE